MRVESGIKEARSPSSLSPSVSYLVSVLDERIQSGHYAHGQRLPAERALCEEFSLSRPTIRQAIDELERRKLIRRSARHRPVIWREDAVNGSGGAPFVPRNGNGGGVARRNIALWISGDPSDPGPMAITRSVYQTLPGDGYRLVMACPQGNSYAEAIRSEADSVLQLADDDDCAGLILWHMGGESNVAPLEAFRSRGKAIVFVDREPPAGFEADFVGIYNEFAAAEAVRYLISLGHRDIVHITNEDRASAVYQRLAGYRQALEEEGIPFRPELVVSSEFVSSREEAVERFWLGLLERLRHLPGPPTAVFAVNDYSAWRIVNAAQVLGVRIPEDLALIGFDNSERWKAATPFLTSVSQPFEQIGVEAVKLLQHRLQIGADGGTYRHVLLPAPLVVRESSGRARDGDRTTV